MPLLTPYTVKDIPLSEYPRPQLRRDSFLCLNGIWDFTKVNQHSTEYEFDKKILVPFSPESVLSGISPNFDLLPDEKSVYRRIFELTADFIRGVTLLHFGAVDQSCVVYINGQKAGTHRGGYTPFCIDVTPYVSVGSNTLLVECTDLTELSQGARGKQSSNPGQIWYTKQSGIWQTVWLESVPVHYVKDLTVKTDAFTKTVTVYSDCEGTQTAYLYDGEALLESKTFDAKTVAFTHDFTLWTPETPKLYDLVIITDSGDTVRSYFGVRSLGIGKDANGKTRLLLNGKPYYFNAVLDQGYWPDGLLTPPCDKAMYDDLLMLKKMGFNSVRKHIKIEPLRWYYYCDLLGLAVWQDFVNGGGEYSFMHVAALPFLGLHHKDSDYEYFARTDADGRREYVDTLHETVATLKNAPSVCIWVPFNEGWGQFDSKKITELLLSLDDTRLIDSCSGWHDQGVENTTMRSMHTYYTPLKVPHDPRPVVLSEFGGYSIQTPEHVFNPDKEFGYKKFKTPEEYADAIEKLFLRKLKPLILKGLCGSVYTQLSDVEEEINGLVTYDRKVIKIDEQRMNQINRQLYLEAEKIPF